MAEAPSGEVVTISCDFAHTLEVVGVGILRAMRGLTDFDGCHSMETVASSIFEGSTGHPISAADSEGGS